MFLVVYVYIGYPLVLLLLSKLKKAKPRQQDENHMPSVSLMVSCYNEIDVIHEKLANALALDYPKDKLNIVVISDGSDDGTDEAAKQYADQGIKLIRQEGRLGKTSAINMAMAECQSEIVVFSDANAMYQADAIKKLVRNFKDDAIGYVVGAALYTDGKENSAAASEDLYWQYEIALKTMESNLHSVVGGDGAIYAIRSNLYIPLDAKDINDFVNPMQIIQQGYSGLFEPEAICLEETAGNFEKEYKRKQRIVNRSFRGLMKVKSVLNPFKFGFFSFEVISHKLLRWFQPVFLAIFAVGSVYLAFAGIGIFKYITALGVAFLWLAQIGYLRSHRQHISTAFFVPYYFIMVNFYSLLGVLTALRGNIQVTWSTPRSSNGDVVRLSAAKKTVLLVFNLITFGALYYLFQ